ncbi:uncharacterized protein An02g07220 [Aspergillus niger]|uniref:Contig An02c0210, genomic contig n=2 Tax=Aspergillus niger TaxID=5061 RepID=A2QDI5_ASPNC|nr:uncharacterized protein An02g07220 [Aspergillus niger]CAK37686.1 unnamed protein product [Aspergillus niger]
MELSRDGSPRQDATKTIRRARVESGSIWARVIERRLSDREAIGYEDRRARDEEGLAAKSAAWVWRLACAGRDSPAQTSAGTAVAGYCDCITRFTPFAFMFKIPRIYPATAANMRKTIHNITCVRLQKS